MADSLWDRRERVILSALTQADDKPLGQHELRAATGLDDPMLMRGLLALKEDGLITGALMTVAEVDHPIAADGIRLTGRGRRVVGAWPATSAPQPLAHPDSATSGAPERPPAKAQALIDAVYPVWSESGTWPTVQWVNVTLRRAGLLAPDDDAAEIASAAGPTLFYGSRGLTSDRPLVLAVGGLAHCEPARENELALFLRVLHAICDLQRAFVPSPTSPGRLVVDREALNHALAPDGGWYPSDTDWKKMLDLLSRDTQIHAGTMGPNEDGGFSLAVSEDVERYSSVGTIDDYVRLLQRALGIASASGLYGGWTASSVQGLLEGNPPVQKSQPTIFIVHGQDHSTLREVELWVRQKIVDAEPIILMDQPNRGKTLVEKLEAEAGSSDYVVVLMTGDDHGSQRQSVDNDQQALAAAKALRLRARQNVVLELGFAFGKLGREHVAVMYDPVVDRPSDIDGIAYIPLHGDWKQLLARELYAAGFTVRP